MRFAVSVEVKVDTRLVAVSELTTPVDGVSSTAAEGVVVTRCDNG